MTAGTIIEVDPKTLTIALNVRTDTKLDKDFVASIRELGVLQPPMVVAADGGGYEVVLGQRRTLAAVEVGLKSIPAYLVDKHEADAARIVDQLTENEQRQGLSEVERVGGYKQLALIGISPSQIAKRTATPRARVDTALAVADNEVAAEALGKFDLTLDQAAELVEFSGDKSAVKKLTDAAENNPGTFAHVVRDLREKRELAVQKAAVIADIEASGYQVLKAADYYYEGVEEGFTRVAEWGSPADTTVELSPSEVADKSLVGARATRSWIDNKYQFVAQYFVRDAEANGFSKKTYAAAAEREPVVLTEEQKAEELAKQERSRLAEERRAQRLAAAQVRGEWIASDLLQRAKLPDAAVVLVPWLIKLDLYVDGVSESDVELISWAGLTMPVSDDEEGLEDEAFTDLLLSQVKAQPKLATRFMLALALHTFESDQRMQWGGSETALVAEYFELLASWGYGLSDYEKSVIEAQAIPDVE
jgi:ParB family transcriptional regulator, chromosome partitioning protein